jgi:hypothetical protein
MNKIKPDTIYALVFSNDTILQSYNQCCMHLKIAANVLKNEDYQFNGLTKIVIDDLFKALISNNGDINSAYALINSCMQRTFFAISHDLIHIDNPNDLIYKDLDSFDLVRLIGDELFNYYNYIFNLFQSTFALEEMIKDNKIIRCINYRNSVYSKIYISTDNFTVIEILDYNRYP